MTSLLLHGAVLGTEDGAVRQDVLVEDGTVVRCAPDLAGRVHADERVDLTGSLVLPGAIDPHTHLHEFGAEYREDFATGTMSAAAGGITTVIDHGLGDPPIISRWLFERKLAEVSGRAYVDFGLWAGAVPGNIAEFAGMAEAGALGVKAFMIGSEPDFPSLTDDQLLAAMGEVARIGSTILVHAEEPVSVGRFTAVLLAAGRRDGLAHARARPPITEVTAVARAIALAHRAACRLQAVHLSTATAIDVITMAKAAGIAVRGEVCPHFLVLSEQDLCRRGPWAKCTPPLRAQAEVDAVWDRVLRGEPDLLASDHAPWPAAEKEAGADDIWQAPNGVISLQHSTVVTLTEGLRRGLTLPAFVRLSSTNAARWLGLYPRKGTLRPGSDADIAIYRTDVSDTIRVDDMLSKQKWTPYEGRRVGARVIGCLVRGRWVYREGRIVGTAGAGSFVGNPRSVAGPVESGDATDRGTGTR